MSTVPAHDPYALLHPDWRRSFQKGLAELKQQLRQDRACGAKVQLEYHGPWVDSSGLSGDELDEGAERVMHGVLQRCIIERRDALEVTTEYLGKQPSRAARAAR